MLKNLLKIVVVILILFSSRFAYSSEIKFSLSAEPKRLVPFLAIDSASAEVSSFIFNGLLKFDKNMRIVGDLSKSYEIKNRGKTIIFHLRKNVFWQDGVPFTADDVIFTYKTIINKNTPTPYAGKYKIIKKLYKTDNYTVVVEYSKPFAPALYSWTMGIVPKHLLEHETDISSNGFNRHPVGTGPYILKEWKTGQFLILKANKHYFLGKPKIDKIIYKIIPDGTTNLLELKNQNLDLMQLSPIQYLYEFDENLKKHYNVYFKPSSGYTYLAFNLKEKIFQNLKIRKAICMSINRKQLKNIILFQYGSVADSIYPKNSPYFIDKNICSYSPTKAYRIFKSLGFTKRSDGYLYKNGKPFQFTIYTNNGNTERKYAAIMIQEYFRQAGIKVKIRILEWQAFIKMINERHFDAIILGWQLGSDPDEYSIWHSSSAKAGAFNFVNFKNKQVDKLIELGRITFNKQERRKIYLKINTLITAQFPYIFLYYPTLITVVNKKFKNIKPEKAGIMYNFIKWSE